MKKALKYARKSIYYYSDGRRIEGIHSRIRGNVSGISGDVSGIRGEVSGISGDVDLCEISEDERKRGVAIEDLVMP